LPVHPDIRPVWFTRILASAVQPDSLARYCREQKCEIGPKVSPSPSDNWTNGG
jgi:hypothetical protein